MEKEQEIIRTSLRLPKKLYDRIAAIADEHGQTMHAEILHMLRDAVEMGEYVPAKNAFEDVLGPIEPTPRDIRDEEILEAIMRDMQNTTLEFAKKIKEQTERIKRHK